MLKPILHPAASEELGEAAVFYEEREPGLGEAFLQEFLSAVEKVLEHPQRWPIREYGFRKIGLRRFRHNVRYIERQDNLYIIAVPHSSRKPGYWKQRTSDEQR